MLQATAASNTINAVLLAVAVVVPVVVIILALAVFAIIRRKRDVPALEATRNDQNPIYGLYYFSDDSRIDSGECEAADANDYYMES